MKTSRRSFLSLLGGVVAAEGFSLQLPAASISPVPHDALWESICKSVAGAYAEAFDVAAETADLAVSLDDLTRPGQEAVDMNVLLMEMEEEYDLEISDFDSGRIYNGKDLATVLHFRSRGEEIPIGSLSEESADESETFVRNTDAALEILSATANRQEETIGANNCTTCKLNNFYGEWIRKSHEQRKWEREPDARAKLASVVSALDSLTSEDLGCCYGGNIETLLSEGWDRIREAAAKAARP